MTSQAYKSSFPNPQTNQSLWLSGQSTTFGIKPSSQPTSLNTASFRANMAYFAHVERRGKEGREVMERGVRRFGGGLSSNLSGDLVEVSFCYGVVAYDSAGDGQG